MSTCISCTPVPASSLVKHILHGRVQFFSPHAHRWYFSRLLSKKQDPFDRVYLAAARHHENIAPHRHARHTSAVRALSHSSRPHGMADVSSARARPRANAAMLRAHTSSPHIFIPRLPALRSSRGTASMLPFPSGSSSLGVASTERGARGAALGVHAIDHQALACRLAQPDVGVQLALELQVGERRRYASSSSSSSRTAVAYVASFSKW